LSTVPVQGNMSSVTFQNICKEHTLANTFKKQMILSDFFKPKHPDNHIRGNLFCPLSKRLNMCVFSFDKLNGNTGGILLSTIFICCVTYIIYSISTQLSSVYCYETDFPWQALIFAQIIYAWLSWSCIYFWCYILIMIFSVHSLRELTVI